MRSARFEQGEIGPDLFRAAAAGSGTGSKSKIGNISLTAACRINSRRNDHERSA